MAPRRRPQPSPGDDPRCRSDRRVAAADEDAIARGLSLRPSTYAAWIGLTPKDHSTAGKVRLGVITRAGDDALRSTLVVGATALLRRVREGRGRICSPWLLDLLKRKPPKLVAVALANKIARIAWKMMVTGEAYRTSTVPPTKACVA